MRIGYFDCYSGISGDMALASIVDAGYSRKKLAELVKSLDLGRVSVEFKEEKRGGIRGTRVIIKQREQQNFRNLEMLKRQLAKARLSEKVKKKSLDVLTNLALAEAKVHKIALEEVHFHELGAVDTLIDVVGVVAGLEDLGIARLYFSTLCLGEGELICQHGKLPVPAPATLELLRGIRIQGGGEKMELVTPTGAALVKTLADGFGPLPEMKLERVGYGAGLRELKDKPNILRLLIGESSFSNFETVYSLEATIDDMNPEYYELLMERLFDAGAKEVLYLPSQMKKNRPGVMVKVIVGGGELENLSRVLFENSTTTGLRFFPVQRFIVSRETETISTKYGKIRVKVMRLSGGEERIHPEYDDLKSTAKKHRVCLFELEQEVRREWERRKKTKR